ncbi:MAG TPA: hypothetical protein VG294_05375 [Solirubrobacteraceae bacterium]|jgi:hypothetical protein|nr:hypothetical protein [Solirubrobacteraceae bacterium]
MKGGDAQDGPDLDDNERRQRRPGSPGKRCRRDDGEEDGGGGETALGAHLPVDYERYGAGERESDV